MSYAKACKYQCGTQIVWDKFANQFKDNQTGEPHTREVCESIRNQKGGSTYKITSPQQQIPISTKSPAFEKYNQNKQTLESAAIQMINTKVDKCLELLKYIIDNTGTAKEISELKTVNAELEAAFEKVEKKQFVPANQVKSEPEEESQEEHDEHVRDMVRKGREEEEMDLT
jgi:hypothetical protein